MGDTDPRVFLSLGSNLGDRWHLISSAIDALAQQVGSIVSIAPYIETQPWGFSSEYLFLNTAIEIKTDLSPMELLKQTQSIEHMLGRKYKHKVGETYQDRPIDIDILLYGEEIVDEGNELQVPHPLLHKRDFVLNPLSAIAPNVVHPTSHQRIDSLLTVITNEYNPPY